METAKIEAAITEQGLEAKITGDGYDIILCIAAVMNALASDIANKEKYMLNMTEATAQVITLAYRKMLELQKAKSEAMSVDAEILKKMMEARQ